VATSLGAYPTFNFHVAAAGGKLVTTPYVDDHENPVALLQLAKFESAKLLYFSNPDNPMGSVWPARDVQHLMDTIPDNTMLLLDEAYIEFAPDGTAPAFDTSRKNVLRFRTFSKAHGLAGIRLGYAIGHADVISAFDKIRNHFALGRIAQAGALAAIQDQDWVQHVKREVVTARGRVRDIASDNGFQALPSATNFMAVDCGKDGAYAKAIVEGMLQHGVFIRTPGVAPLNRCIRISCGDQKSLDLLAEALPRQLDLLASAASTTKPDSR
jgi:histidinol-phosphate aminotransferase